MINDQKLILSIFILFFLVFANSQSLYNPSCTSMRNQTWMSLLDYGLPIRQMSIMGTQQSVVFSSCFFITAITQQRQACSLQIQLQSGIRAIDIHVAHNNDKFQVSDRGCNQGTFFNQVLTTVKNFLTTYPTETVLLHLVEQTKSSGCTRTFEDTFISYRDSFPGLFWTPTTQDPQLGDVRGQIVLLQQFNSLVIHGLLWATFSVLPNKYFNTNWDLYSKWTDIKNFLPGVNTAKKSKIMYWTGHGGSYPYFVVGGVSSMNGGKLWTGLLTPSFNGYPDFPRVGCFWGICRVNFQGMNIMSYNYIVGNNFAYTGIVYTSFIGDDLLKRVVGSNTAIYPKCSTTQVSQGCTLCQMGTGACLKCNTKLHYVYDAVNKICLAQVGYYLDSSYVPQLCSLAQPGCMECTSATTCTKCDILVHYLLSSGQCIAQPGYYLDASFFPQPCPQIGCAQCSDAISCTVCSAPLNYIMDPGTLNSCMCDSINFFEPAPSVQACICMATYFLSPASTCLSMPTCPDVVPIGGCLNCDPDTNDCLLCDTANNFIFDPTDKFCICDVAYFYDGTACSSCTVNDAACNQCANANLCLSCVANFTLTAGVCQCNFQYYKVDPDTCNQCSTGCLVCTGIGACTVCDATKNFILSGGYCQCVIGMYQSGGVCYPCGNMAGCLDCNTAGCTLCDPMFGFHLSGTVCACDYGFFINAMKVCEQCMMQGCLNCLSQTQCIECDTSLYYLSSAGTCDDICGDGFKIYVDCDDGNTLNGDGCSSTCKVQTDYTCIGGSMTSNDFCSYSGLFNLTIVKTVKDEKQNKVFIELVISPNILSLTGIDFSAAMVPTFSYQSKTATFDSNKSKISFQFTYNSSLNALSSNDLGIKFDPPTSLPNYLYMKPASANLPQVTDNNLALKYYDTSIYDLLDMMKTLSQITAFLYIGVCFMCFLFVSKLIAIQLILVPQIAFAGLIMIQKIQSLLQPLNKFRFTNGYNPLFTDTIQLPPRLLILFYQGQFLSNFNTCIVAIFIPVLIGLLMLIIGKIRKSKAMLKFSYKTLKQWVFCFLLIFQFQYTISFGIDFLYGTSMIGKILGGILFVGLISFSVLLYKRPLNFGEFKSFFIREPLPLNFYIFVVVFRLFLALDLVILSSNKACGFVAVGISVFYTLIMLILRPYAKSVRPIINMVVTIIILVVESIYKLNFYSSQSTFITSYLPLFIVILLLVLLLINVVFIILEIREKYKKKQIDEYQKNANQSFDQEMKRQMQKQMEVINTIQLALNPTHINKIEQKQQNQNSPQDKKKKANIQLKSLRKQMQKNILIPATPVNLSQKNQLIYTQI